jgi:hypothetical protein
MGQLLELIESVPDEAVSAELRVTIAAVTPGAIDFAAVDTCVPGWPVKSQVASMPAKAIAQLPPDGPCRVQTALPLPAAGTQV